MKKLFIAALLVVGLTTFAQDKKERPRRADMEKMTPEQRSERRLERMKTELNLDEKQQEQVKQLFAEQDKKWEANRGEMQNRREMSREKMEEERKMMNDKMKAILNPEQFKKWKENQEKRRQRMQERMRDRMDDGMKGNMDGGMPNHMDN